MVIFSFIQLHAQTTHEETSVQELLAKASDFSAKENYTASNNALLEAANIFQKNKEWEKWYNAYYEILKNGFYARNYDDAVKLLQQGLPQLPEDQFLLQGKMQYMLGYATDAMGDIWSSLVHYEKSIANFKKTNDFSSINLVLGNIGIVCTKLGDYKKAQEYAKIAVELSKEYKNTEATYKNTKVLGDAYFYAGEFEKAQKTYKEAQRIKDPKDGTFELFEADILLQLKKYEEALSVTKRIIQITKNCLLTSSENRYMCKENLNSARELQGEIYLEMDKPKEALTRFSASLNELSPSNRSKRETGKLYIYSGDALLKLQKFDNALEMYQIALQTFFQDFKESDPTKNPPEEMWQPEIWLMEIFKNKGDCYLAKYKVTADEQWLHLATEHYQLAVNSSEFVRLNFSEKESKLLLGSYSNAFYEDLVNAKLELYALTKEVTYQEEAFRISQRANAFVLRTLLNEKQALKVAGLPKDSVALFQKFEKEIAILNWKVEVNIETATSQKELLQTKENFQNLKKTIAKNYPKFDKLRNDLEGISVRDIQKAIDPNTIFIKYFLGADTLYVFTITATDFYTDAIALPENFETVLSKYRQTLSDVAFVQNTPRMAEKKYLETAHTLYNILLEKPLQKTYKNTYTALTIVPDGILHTIPFQTLRENKSNSWTNLKHTVLKRYAVSYHYFSKMMQNSEVKTTSDGAFASFGLEFDDNAIRNLEQLIADTETTDVTTRSNVLSKLSYADDEAQQLAELMQGKSWVNAAATKNNFINHTSNASSIHLATHALVNTENPAVSALIFANTQDSIHNILRLDEIYNQTFNAEMITLSACNTGFGKYQKGEGLQSLARAFNFANIPSITATLWSIPDAASSKIMKLYYSYLKKGHPKHIALQKAQISYVEDDDISSPASRLPFYWSAWTHIGEDTSITFKQESGFSTYLIILLFVICIFIDIYVVREIRRN
ncbi:MAG: CHAT domain-containing protein [Bacteroidota bacterium]